MSLVEWDGWMLGGIREKRGDEGGGRGRGIDNGLWWGIMDG